MLWRKAWLETRWRFMFILGMAALTIALGEQGGGLGSVEHAGNLMRLQSMLAVYAAIYLAGSGIKTQSAFRVKRGLHGSTHFTLSLPVSRLRLLAVRASFGFLETAGVITFMTVSTWLLFPLVRGDSTLLDLLRLAFAAIICVSCFYFVSVTVATVLDETWQIYGSVFVAGVVWWISSRMALPSPANVLPLHDIGFPARNTPIAVARHGYFGRQLISASSDRASHRAHSRVLSFPGHL